MKLYRPQPHVTISLKDESELRIMREAGRIVAKVHEAVKPLIRPGVSTGELDRIAEQVIRDNGGVPVFIGQQKPNSPPYQFATTASVNNQVVHGIPSDTQLLADGDIISLDTGVLYRGFVGDSAWTYGVGEVKPSVQRLLDVTEQALYVGIEQAVVGRELRDLSRTIQQYIDSHGYGIVRDYTGHGVGTKMWEEPQVPNWWPRNAKGRLQFDNVRLVTGMTFAIEPMVCSGTGDVRELDDHWTVVTADNSLCAHFEHTVAVTENGPLILTAL